VVRQGSVYHYISEARKFAESAVAEFGRWEKEKEDVLIRDAAEKAWNAVLQATNALLLGRGFPEEKIRSHKDRRLALDTLELRDSQVREKGFRDRFGAREHNLHERCFYEGEYVPEKIKEDILKAREYVEDVKQLLETG